MNSSKMLTKQGEWAILTMMTMEVIKRTLTVNYGYQFRFQKLINIKNVENIVFFR